MDLPKSVANVEALIRNEVQESISLDYKASAAIDKSKRREIAKDVSAFANSAGGVLLYGVAEEDHLPTAIDGGVDHGAYSREWLEQVILSNISPRIGGLTIAQIPVSETHSLFAVSVGQTVRAPHAQWCRSLLQAVQLPVCADGTVRGRGRAISFFPYTSARIRRRRD